MKTYRILVINPGSTSTKVAVFDNEELILEENIFHDSKILNSFNNDEEQLEFRMSVLSNVLAQHNIDFESIDAFSGRGGNTKSLPSGTYRICEEMVSDCLNSNVKHPSNYGPALAYRLAKKYGKPAYTTDPIVVDEYQDIARLTGIKGLYRTSRCHALNQKGMAKEYAKSIGKKYEDLNLIVCHMDGGITACAHHKGLMIDGNDGAGGEGSYTPTRIGSIPVNTLFDYLKDKDIETTRKICTSKGGFVSYFNTSNKDEIYHRFKEGDYETSLVFKGISYNISKLIGSLATVLRGKVDGIVIGGGLVHYQELIDDIKDRCSFIAPITILYEEYEHKSLAYGALAVLKGEESAKEYVSEPVFKSFKKI